MAQRRDILANHKVCDLRVHASQEVGAADQLTIDLMELSDSPGLYERTAKGLLIIEVSALEAGGTLDIILEDSPDGTTYDADFATLDQIDATGLYVAVVDGINRYFNLAATVGTAAVTWGAKFVGFEATRAPVKQTDATELTTTYASDREG